MKKILLSLLLCVGFQLAAQVTLTDKQKAKAERMAKAEEKMFVKKGMSNAASEESLFNVLKDFYEHVYLESSPNNRVYVWGMGNGKADSEQEAYQEALSDAKNHIPGVLSLYFNMWVMASDALTEEEKSKVQSAVNDAVPVFSTSIMTLEPYKLVYLKSENKGKYRSQVRVLYAQEEVREMARLEIIKFVKDETGWNDQKARSALTFKH